MQFRNIEVNLQIAYKFASDLLTIPKLNVLQHSKCWHGLQKFPCLHYQLNTLTTMQNYKFPFSLSTFAPGVNMPICLYFVRLVKSDCACMERDLVKPIISLPNHWKSFPINFNVNNTTLFRKDLCRQSNFSSSSLKPP